jgi:hypothetical protein
MATIPPSSANPIQPFRFLNLSPELRNKIYELVLQLNRPVNLTSTSEIYQRHRGQHVAGCPSKNHPQLPNVIRGNGDANFIAWCVDPFTNKERRLDPPRSVLALRHVCKQISIETRFTFFAINEFYFSDANCAQTAFASMANEDLTGAIRKMGFNYFGDCASKLYRDLATAAPNIRVLKVAMDIEDKRVKISGKEKTLRKARGISFFVTYISKLESLEEFEIVGRDKVYEVVNNELVPVLVDINDPRAIGPWFKAMIENERKQRERADWKEVNKKRIEKEFKELEEKEAATKLKIQQDRQQLIARWTGVPRPFAS